MPARGGHTVLPAGSFLNNDFAVPLRTEKPWAAAARARSLGSSFLGGGGFS